MSRWRTPRTNWLLGTRKSRLISVCACSCAISIKCRTHHHLNAAHSHANTLRRLVEVVRPLRSCCRSLRHQRTPRSQWVRPSYTSGRSSRGSCFGIGDSSTWHSSVVCASVEAEQLMVFLNHLREKMQTIWLLQPHVTQV